jgi:hypothetical protein
MTIILERLAHSENLNASHTNRNGEMYAMMVLVDHGLLALAVLRISLSSYRVQR